MEHTQANVSAPAQKHEIVHVDPSFAPLGPKFMANRKKEIITMQAALVGQDFEAVRKIAHGMKGAGGSYGFSAVSTMAAAIEAAAKQYLPAMIEEELNMLSAYLDHVEVVFDGEMSRI